MTEMLVVGEILPVKLVMLVVVARPAPDVRVMLTGPIELLA